MRVLSLHNIAKYGCFVSINDKIINNLLRWGRFQPNFRRPLASKLWRGPKKSLQSKTMALTTSITMQNLVEILRRKSAREDKMWCFSLFLKITLVDRRPLWCVVELFPQDIASAFIGRFGWCLQPFFAKENRFPGNGTVFKIVASWRYDWYANARGNCQNPRKWLQSLCAPLRPFRSELKENFTTAFYLMYIVDVHSYKNISLPR